MNSAIIFTRTIFQTLICLFIIISLHILTSIILVKKYNKISLYVSSMANNYLANEISNNKRIFSSIIKNDYKSILSPKCGINVVTLKYPNILINEMLCFEQGILLPKSLFCEIKNLPEIKSKLAHESLNKSLISDITALAKSIFEINQHIKIILHENDLVYINIDNEFVIKMFPWQKFSKGILNNAKYAFENSINRRKIKNKNIACFDITAFDKKKIIYETVLSKEML
jgi:hypothetical protein